MLRYSLGSSHDKWCTSGLRYSIVGCHPLYVVTWKHWGRWFSLRFQWGYELVQSDNVNNFISFVFNKIYLPVFGDPSWYLGLLSPETSFLKGLLLMIAASYPPSLIEICLEQTRSTYLSPGSPDPERYNLFKWQSQKPSITNNEPQARHLKTMTEQGIPLVALMYFRYLGVGGVDGDFLISVWILPCVSVVLPSVKLAVPESERSVRVALSWEWILQLCLSGSPGSFKGLPVKVIFNSLLSEPNLGGPSLSSVLTSPRFTVDSGLVSLGLEISDRLRVSSSIRRAVSGWAVISENLPGIISVIVLFEAVIRILRRFSHVLEREGRLRKDNWMGSWCLLVFVVVDMISFEFFLSHALRFAFGLAFHIVGLFWLLLGGSRAWLLFVARGWEGVG